MKRCQYCGKAYSDKLTVCPTDGQPLIDPEAIVERVADQALFHATLTLPVSRSGKYQIYVRGGDLIFILTEATAHSILNSIHGFLGSFGAFIPLTLWLFSRRQTKDQKERLERADPEDLIRDDEKNFRLHLSEIREATLEPAAYWRFSGRSAGCLNLLVRQGEKMKLELAASADVVTVQRLLGPQLSGILKVNIEGDETSGQCQKKKTAGAI